MRRLLIPFFALLLVVTAGCAFTGADKPREQWAVAAAAYTAAVKGASALAEAGKLDLDQAETFERARRHARAALDAAERVLLDPARRGSTLVYVSEAARLVQDLVAIEARYRSGGP